MSDTTTNAHKKSKFKLYLSDTWLSMKKHKACYLFLAPFAIIFTTFNILPVLVSIYFSFTDFNVLEPAEFIGFTNYINLVLADDVFSIGVQNTLLLAFVTGPIGYLAAYLFAWLINELPRYLKSFAVLVFYAPSISGSVYLIWNIIFSGDAYGYLNGFLINLGIITEPVLWLTNTNYMMPIVIIVVLWASLGAGFLGFLAGFKGVDKTLYEAAYVDGIKNRWQELWYVTLPSMKPMLLFGAVMAITQAFNVSDVPKAIVGYPSTDYAVRTVVTHLVDYGSERLEMGYASAIATVLFLTLVLCKSLVQKMLKRVGQ